MTTPTSAYKWLPQLIFLDLTRINERTETEDLHDVEYLMISQDIVTLVSSYQKSSVTSKQSSPNLQQGYDDREPKHRIYHRLHAI